MKKEKFFLLIIIVFASACSNSESLIQTAIAETEAAKPTFTFTPAATSTLPPTNTATAVPTSTNTPSPTPDLRIIEIESNKFLMDEDDLPSNAKYYIPTSRWMSPHHNSEIISGWGQEEGLEYLEKTQRIDGWFVQYLRGTETVRAPKYMYHNIIQYGTIEGAEISLFEFNSVETNPDENKYVDRDLSQIGCDNCIAYLNKEMDSSGKYFVWYSIKAQYRNYVSIVAGGGFEDEVEYDYVENIAKVVLEKLKRAELVEP